MNTEPVRITLEPAGFSPLESVESLHIKGHPDIDNIRLSVSYGPGDPDFQRKQGVPEVTFSLKVGVGKDENDPELVATHSRLSALLASQTPPVEIRETNRYFLGLKKPHQLHDALIALGFDSPSIGALANDMEDVQSRFLEYTTSPDSYPDLRARLDPGSRAQGYTRQQHPPKFRE